VKVWRVASRSSRAPQNSRTVLELVRIHAVACVGNVSHATEPLFRKACTDYVIALLWVYEYHAFTGRGTG